MLLTFTSSNNIIIQIKFQKLVPQICLTLRGPGVSDLHGWPGGVPGDPIYFWLYPWYFSEYSIITYISMLLMFLASVLYA